VKTNSRVRVSEAGNIADQLRRAFYGSAWHGPALMELLKDVAAATAAAKPLPGAHSIWELVLHIRAWDGAGLQRLAGHKCQLQGGKNFPPVPEATEMEWRNAVKLARGTHDSLVRTVAGLSSKKLRETVPGKRYDFYHLLHGIAQHELYHAGQIAILKKAQRESK
jgi:uncharacterized damage-inducible protein DinB